MSFNFDARADSSDEDVALDINAWKSAASLNGQPPPPKRRGPSSSAALTPNIGSGFQAINKTPTTEGRPHGSNGSTGDETARRKPFAGHEGALRDDEEDDLEEAMNVAEDILHAQNENEAALSNYREAGDEALESSPSVKQRPLRHVEIPPFLGNLSDFEDQTSASRVVRRVWGERADLGSVNYEVQFEDGQIDLIPSDELSDYENGQAALTTFRRTPKQLSSLTRARRGTGRPPKRDTAFVSSISAIGVSSEEDDFDVLALHQTSSRGKRGRMRDDRSAFVADADDEGEDDDSGIDDEDDETFGRGSRRTRRSFAKRSLRNTKKTDQPQEIEEYDHDDMPLLESDVGPRRRRANLRSSRSATAEQKELDDFIAYDRPSKRQRVGDRHSGRVTRHTGNMQEVDIDQIYRFDSEDETKAPAKPKVTAAKEVFKQLPSNDEFRMRHCQECETCGHNANYAPLIFCQGCTLAYHKSCLGPRSGREHLVTKIGEDDFVLQCRRCIASARKRDANAPDQGRCSDCREHGAACLPFRPRKTPPQEQRERDENDIVDPVVLVNPSVINNVDIVLFRCLTCWRAFHFVHLPSRNEMIMDLDGEIDAEQRFREYSRDWKCKECFTMPAKVGGLIAWKPIDEDAWDASNGIEGVDEDNKAYLVKWDGMSYFRADWMPGAWIWGVTSTSTRKAFAKRPESFHPKMRVEDAIPEDYLRADTVMDIKYTSYVEIRGEEIDKARIREVDKALIKYKGLGYEDAVWEKPPVPEDGDRWTDFVTAYNDWVVGRYVKQPTSKSLKSRVDKTRQKDFHELERKEQPSSLTGGELMKYQIEGLNWLFYKWHSQKNAILADEMGLGKTIQVIAFLATMMHEIGCYPFLIVVPNSTCANWRREIKRWAPSLRVVAYFGSKEAREAAYKYELFPEGSKELKCHVVITSYETAANDDFKKFTRSVNWQGLIVDEGQRLKSEKTHLYAALGALKAPFKVLLTGTPLQNNQRELFNLLQFLDDSHNAADLEKEYEELTAEKIAELHNMIRPFFLRRTKAQVLTFLPPMAQIIVPVSMTLVQKKVYRTILAKNPELMKSIFSSEGSVDSNTKGSLNNVLMQLRKCLCHPFVYSRSIEDRKVSVAASHRNLVDASSKLKLLELLLPKLKDLGHRVLIFSQFLDMLDIVEDFLDGMQMRYQRLDGSMNSLNKQKRIDEFNAPESPLFAFLLSTRAGGVGINLATADTVIIMDPDFNPHQDIQALSRAHRIGQHKKVLCFQLVTRASAEEKIMQIGRKKLLLDHVLIREMDDDDATESDLTAILRHGASELFNDTGEQDINYDSLSVDKLLNRSHIEDTQAGKNQSAESTFSFARVWANDSGALEDTSANESEELPPDAGVWESILRERERLAAEEAAAKAEAFGRGRRARQAVGYAEDNKELEGVEGLNITPVKMKKTKTGDESDTDFQDDETEAESDQGENLGDVDDADAALIHAAKHETDERKGKRQTPRKAQKSVPDDASTPSGFASRRFSKVPVTLKGSASSMRKSQPPGTGLVPNKPETARRKASAVLKVDVDVKAKNLGGKASSDSMKRSPAVSNGKKQPSLCLLP